MINKMHFQPCRAVANQMTRIKILLKDAQKGNTGYEINNNQLR